MKRPDFIGVDIDPAFAAFAGRTLTLALAFAAVILISAVLEHVALWTIVLMAAMFILGAGANAMAISALTGASIIEVVQSFKALQQRHTIRKGRIELGDEPEESGDLPVGEYYYGQRLRVLRGFNDWEKLPGFTVEQFVHDGDMVRVALPAHPDAVSVITDDGAHITVPKRFLESLD